MKKNMLIDGAYPEETRVIVTNDGEIEDFDYETKNKRQIRGNLYLAKVDRVEPSLQAAFVDYGKERHGFLSFNEIHPDYFQIPVADRKILVQHEKELTEKFATKESNGPENGNTFVDDKEIIQDSNNNFFNINVRLNKEREKLFNKYRIQEVIKKGQILLIQVVKEERGNKGAALTTYISLAGRYCVLMANTARKGGISRRITQSNTRKKLRSILDSLNTPENMAVIIRTAGEKRTKLEIKRDFNYLLKTWKKIRQTTLNSVAPILIHEENNVIKRAIRDLLTSEISNVFIEGEFAFKSAREYMKTLIPSKVKIIKKYIEKTPLFQFYSFESKLDKIHDPIVNLDNGGYIVINQTEALVAVDVNSGRATKERNIEETALQTNKQAAAELCRQIKIRNLSGLIVIDFIDMLEHKNNRIIENTLKQTLSRDRAKIQVGQISSFGLLEMSRQRIGPNVYEADFIDCHSCHASGKVRSLESNSLKVLRQIQEKSNKIKNKSLYFKIKKDIGFNILNKKRKELSDIENRNKNFINIIPDEHMVIDCVFIEPIENLQSNAKSIKKEESSNNKRSKIDGIFSKSKDSTNKKYKNSNTNLKNENKLKTVKKELKKNRIVKKVSNKVNKKLDNTKFSKTSEIIPINFEKNYSKDIDRKNILPKETNKLDNKTHKKNVRKIVNKKPKTSNQNFKNQDTKAKVSPKIPKAAAKSGWWNKNINTN